MNVVEIGEVKVNMVKMEVAKAKALGAIQDDEDRRFWMMITYVAIWVCNKCDRGWVYQDKVLSHIGRAWHSLESARIPDGALAVLGEEML